MLTSHKSKCKFTKQKRFLYPPSTICTGCLHKFVEGGKDKTEKKFEWGGLIQKAHLK